MPISAGMGYLGGAAIGGAAGLFGASSANQAARDEAKRQREFQAMMSSTAHQREVWDLELVGLNPILSATGGSGASTPSGAQAPVQNVGQAAGTSALAGASAAQASANAKIAKNQMKVSNVETDILTSAIGRTIGLPISVFKKMGFGDKTALAMGAAYSAGDIKKGISSAAGGSIVDMIKGLWSSAKNVDANGKKFEIYNFNEIN